MSVQTNKGAPVSLLKKWSTMLMSSRMLTGYVQAIDYYNIQKDKMLNLIANEYKKENSGMSESMLDEFKRTLENGFQMASKGTLQNTTVVRNYTTASEQQQEKAADILSNFTEFLSNNELLQNYIKNNQQQLENYNPLDYKWESVKRKRNDFFDSDEFKEMFTNILTAYTNSTGTNFSNTAKQALIGYMKTITFLSLTKDKNFNFTNLKEYKEKVYQGYISNIGGDLYEFAAKDAILQMLNDVSKHFNFLLNSEKKVVVIGGKNLNEMDIQLFRGIDGIKDKEYTGYSYFNEQELQNYLTMVEKDTETYFGAQVKSFSLQKLANNKIRRYLAIGYRAQLNDILLNNEYYHKGYSMIANMMFMAQRNHIIAALGPHNVIFITGDSRYWMSEFIKQVYGQGLRLQLDMQGQIGEKRTTAHVGWYEFVPSKYAHFLRDKKI